MMEKKRVLITGAAGFLGSHLCDRFIREGFYVIAMDNLITGSLKNIEHLFKLPDFEFYHHDVTKFIHINGKIDYILHFASPASPIDYLTWDLQKQKAPPFLLLPRAKYMAIRLCIRNRKNTGVMLILLVRAVFMTRRNGIWNRSLWLTIVFIM
jgi:hypothetical protein